MNNRNLMQYLPAYYENNKEMQSIMDAETDEIKNLNQIMLSILEQCFVITATYGLSNWENDLGLPIDESIPLADRKSHILAVLNSNESCNLTTVKRVIKAFTGIDLTCYEKDIFRAGYSKAGDVYLGRDYPYTIRRKFLFVAGHSYAGEEVWDRAYQSTLMINVTELFRAGYSKAGDRIYVLDSQYSYLGDSIQINKDILRATLERILPARVRLIIN